MKTTKVLATGIIFGLALYGIFSLLGFGTIYDTIYVLLLWFFSCFDFSVFSSSDFNTIYGGVICAILVGIITGRLVDDGPISHAFVSISAYNLIAFAIMASFDPHDLGVGIFVGFMMIMTVLYSIIGSFSAFVAYNIRTDKQG